MLLGREPKPNERKLKAVAVAVLVLVGVALGVVASFSARWIAEGAAGSYAVRAVVTVYDSETDEGQNGPSTTYNVEALTEDGRAISLPGDREFGLAEPVVVRLSSLTDRVLAVRGADDMVKSHDRVWNAAFAIAGVLAVLLTIWSTVAAWRVVSPVVRPGHVLLSVLVGAVAAGFVVLSPAALGRGAFIDSTEPVPNLSDSRVDGPAPVVERGQAVQNKDFTVRASDVRRGVPAGAAPWLSEFDVVTVRVEASRLTDDPIPLDLRADEHGQPELVRDCAGAPGAFDPKADGDTGLVCFVVPPGYQPTHLVVGSHDQRAMLTL